MKYTMGELREHLADIERELKHERDHETRCRLEAERDATKRELILAHAENPGCLERGSGGGDVAPKANTDRDKALRAIERHADMLTAKAGDRLETLVRKADPLGLGAKYIEAVADPDYESAFALILTHPTDAHLRMNPRQHEAFRRVNAVIVERSMNEGSPGSAGGYGLSFSLDPTILLSSAGVLNPIRSVARVITIAAGNTWKGVSSDGVVSHWYPEEGEVSDDTPTLAQPTVTVRRASTFVPFDFELEQDYVGLTQELVRLMSDAKDTLESAAFLSGVAASNQPIGILAATGGLSASQKIDTAGSTTFAVGDNYLLKAAIPARFQPGAVVLANPATFDTIYRQVGGGSTEPPVLPTRDGAWLGLPKYEWSEMATGVTASTKTMLAGNIRECFQVVDRIGMQVEIVQNLVGAAHRPTAQRGLLAWWRVGSAPVNPNAARFLSIKS